MVKKFTLPWESNPGPTPIRGDTATLIASVGLKKQRGTKNKEVVLGTKRWYQNQLKGGLQKSPSLGDSLEIIDIGEKVLEKSEAVSAACVRSQLVVSDQV